MNAGKRRHFRTLWISALAWTLGVSFLYLSATWLLELVRFPYRSLELRTQSLVTRQARLAPADPRVVFLADDAQSHTLDQLWEEDFETTPIFKLMKKRVWSREIAAQILERLASAGAKVVAFDYLYLGEDDGDPAFRAALDKWRDRVVVGVQFEDARMGSGLEEPTRTLLPARDTDRTGFANIWPDEDGVVRRAWMRRSALDLSGIGGGTKQTVYESLAAATIRKAGFGELIPQDRDSRVFRFAFRGEQVWEKQNPPSIYSIFLPAMWEGTNYRNGEFFRDKIVLVGPEGQYHKDLYSSPFGMIAGPEFHLNAMNALLQQQFLRDTSPAMDLGLIAVCGLLALLAGRFLENPYARIAVVVGMAIGGFWAAVLAHDLGWVAPVLSPLLVLVGTTATFSIAEQIADRRERSRMRKTMERYVSRDIVKELLDNPESYLNTLGGARKQVTVLFSDVRGFTTLTESSDAQALVTQLNEYFTEMVHIVFAHRGTLDKFIGDAVMAHWGSIVSEGEANDARNAVATALEMRRALLRLNPAWKERGMLELNFGIGVNQGEVIAGNLGASGDYEKMEITVIGDAVNLASRLEGVTKTYHIDLCIGENVAALVRDNFILRSLDLIVVKGKTKPVEIFAVLDERSPTSVEPTWLPMHEAAMRCYREGAFTEAERSWREVLAQNPGDSISELFLERCADLQIRAPIEDWKGVFEMKSK
jgi:adenylate cyclase